MFGVVDEPERDFADGSGRQSSGDTTGVASEQQGFGAETLTVAVEVEAKVALISEEFRADAEKRCRDLVQAVVLVADGETRESCRAEGARGEDADVEVGACLRLYNFESVGLAEGLLVPDGRQEIVEALGSVFDFETELCSGGRDDSILERNECYRLVLYSEVRVAREAGAEHAHRYLARRIPLRETRRYTLDTESYGVSPERNLIDTFDERCCSHPYEKVTFDRVRNED